MRMSKLAPLVLACLLLAPPAATAKGVVTAKPGSTVERHMPSDAPSTLWALDPEILDSEAGDELGERDVLAETAETVKLQRVVPPIHFESGIANIPASYIDRLRVVLDSMRHLDNVRLHMVGHADDQPLSSSLSGVYGDNLGLSRERAGEVAEFIQTALGLPPEAISFAWAGDGQPIASNDTAAGRAQNRRVEVEVWYDEIHETSATEEIVISRDIKRVKVCRTETVCKLRYRDGHSQRARVRNLVAPLHLPEDSAELPEDFVRQVGEALENLRSKQNVTAKFIGFTDDTPLSGRTERIYGTHLSLSKARALRVALAIQDTLALPTAAIASDGRGASAPIASNETERGRALNRRIEVEFWHDDPLQELPGEPQLCPDAAGAELVTRIYDPPWGRIAALPIENGQPAIPQDYAANLQRAMDDLAGRTNVRLRFIGYTNNERLDRRTALAYGDDIGLSAARARRAMEAIQSQLELSDAQVEHEGRGYVHSNDVVNAGFIQGESAHVVAQVVYDELALLDDLDGVEITPITRELTPKDPLALNLMHITVDGVPIDDPSRSSQDVQRCTDVALEEADIRFRFDNASSQPRLSVTSQPTSLALEPSPEGFSAVAPLLFRTYSNYPHFIAHSEIRIFDRGQSLRAEPLAVLEVGPEGLAEWAPSFPRFAAPRRELQYVVRVYDDEDRFDETTPQSLWMILENRKPMDFAPEALVQEDIAPTQRANPSLGNALLAGYGESEIATKNIPLGKVGTVLVEGGGIPPEHTVFLAGTPVPVDESGNFAAEAILPSGQHTVEVAVLDPDGNGELFLRDLDFEQSEWFYVAIADVTLSAGKTNGPADSLDGENATYDRDSLADGRLAFFVNGKFSDDWELTASADTREGAVEDLFSNFMDKSPEALFRRIDPDYHYPTFGDDGTVEEGAPTTGKFYIKVDKAESHALWGNFAVGYRDNELAQVERGLYGANLHYQSPSTTSFGDQRVTLDGFVAQPGTAPSREEFRGTGGSLYFLRRQDLLIGSERVRLETRDRDSGLVTGVVYLSPDQDYDIDYLQGRILLSEAVPAIVGNGLLVRDQGLSGNEAWLVVQYEYTPGFEDLDELASGGQAHLWLNDFAKLGVTLNRNDDSEADSSLYAGDLTLRKSSDSWLKLQVGRSEGVVSESFISDDGGFGFLGTAPARQTEAEALGYRADLSVGFDEIVENVEGRMSVYFQRLEAGYSAPGLGTLTDTNHYGGAVQIPVMENLDLTAKADRVDAKQGLTTTAAELDLGYRFSDRWGLGFGARYDSREDDAPLVVATQDEGMRTDATLQVDYDSQDAWRAYGFAQGTLAKTDDRQRNDRFGLGGAYQLNEKLQIDGEASYGGEGPALQLGTSYQQSEETSQYFNYALDNERGMDGQHARRGTMVSGIKSRLGDSGSVYREDRWQHTNSSNGLSRAFGLSFSPDEQWSVGGNWELGTLIDRRTNAETKRRAGGASIGYATKRLQLSSGIEYRFDEAEQPDESFTERTTWLFRNSVKFQATPGLRLLGKFNRSTSDSSLGDFYDGGYTEAVLGAAYRPIEHDRFNGLFKYTYFYNLPSTDQVGADDNSIQFIQKSHVAAVDLSYDVTGNWTVGGKYAYRLGQVSLDREDPKFFSNDAHLFILRNDVRLGKNWEGSVEGRMLHMPDLDERRTGALVTIYRYLGEHLKIGVGYNFTDFSDDLTDLSYDHQGVFFNLIGTL
jgi:flagellar motor protein MotB